MPFAAWLAIREALMREGDHELSVGVHGESVYVVILQDDGVRVIEYDVEEATKLALLFGAAAKTLGQSEHGIARCFRELKADAVPVTGGAS